MKNKNRKHLEYIGDKIGAIRIKDFKSENKKGFFYCICDCGKEKWMRSDQVLSGNANTKSCGCRKGTFKHGMSNTKLFNTWANMKQRCSNPNCNEYKYYGGRGIKVCEEWLDKENGFINFYNWAMNNGYEDLLTLDRINVDGDYEPGNCRWATNLEQMNNIRRNHVIEIEGVKKTVSEWARESGLSRPTIKNRALESKNKNEILKKAHEAEFKSGVKGVKWDKSKQRWKVDTIEDGKVKHIGYFRDLDKAIAAKNIYGYNKSANIHNEKYMVQGLDINE